jgi:Cellulase (glycosyl hydrolase family 5)
MTPNQESRSHILSRRTALQRLGLGTIAAALPAGAVESPLAEARPIPPSTPSALPGLVVPDGLFVNPRGDNTEQIVKLVKSLGLESIRMGFIWISFEKTKGADFDFSKHDRMMAEFRQAGIKRFIGLIGSQNEAYHCVWRQKDPALREEALAAFAKFAGAVAARYRDYDILWEIINEPNENNDMTVVSNYVRVCEVLYPLIKAANPSAKVSVGSIAMQSDAWLEQAIKEGLWKHGDVIAVHPYTFIPPLPPEQVAVWYGQIRDGMYARHVPPASRKPIAVTEWGYSTSGHHSSLTPQVQAEYLVRAYLVSLLNGVPVVNLYELADNPAPPADSAVEASYGIFTKDFADKPAAVALRTMVAKLRGCRLSHRLVTDNPDDYVAAFDNGGKRILAAWTSAAPHQMKLAISSGKAVVTDLAGSPRELPATDGHVTLDLTGAVQYVEA